MRKRRLADANERGVMPGMGLHPPGPQISMHLNLQLTSFTIPAKVSPSPMGEQPKHLVSRMSTGNISEPEVCSSFPTPCFSVQ